ncbi:MAG: DUF5696 domain-containing protein [Victivallaceae bacterium]|nr:DUF5696 domain-containing protein [Victivallaceae bacterium]
MTVDDYRKQCLGKVTYYTNYADFAEVEISEAGGWQLEERTFESGQRTVHCANARLGFEWDLSFQEAQDSLILRLPVASIRENKQNKLKSIRLLPEFGRQKIGDDGNFILPQQSGVVTYFKNHVRACHTIGIYGGGVSECTMPIWGIRDGSSALLCGIIASGNCDAALVLAIDQGELHSCTLSPEFYFRYEFSFRRPDFPIMAEDIEVRYKLLHNVAAPGYAQLAKEYRSYLLSTGRVRLLRDRAAESPELAYSMNALEIRIRCAIKWPYPPKITEQTLDNEPETHVLCSFEHAGEIVNEIARQGIARAEFCMVGYGPGGHDGRCPQFMPPEEKCGGELSLRKLIEQAKSSGYAIASHDNNHDAYTVSPDWDENILARSQEMMPLKDGIWGGGQAYLLCPEAMLAKYTVRNLAEEKALGFRGLHFTDCLSTTGLRPCYDKRHFLKRSDTAKFRRIILETARSYFGGVQCEGPLDFAIPALDRIMYVESADDAQCGLKTRDYVDAIVPLWEMVYHGIVVYNVSTDSINALPGSNEYLRNLEYGAMPLYYFHRNFNSEDREPEILPEGSPDFRATSPEKLAMEVEIIRRGYEDFCVTLGDRVTTGIVNHERLGETLVRTTYEDGVCIYVNYAFTEEKADGIVVPPRSFYRKALQI